MQFANTQARYYWYFHWIEMHGVNIHNETKVYFIKIFGIFNFVHPPVGLDYQEISTSLEV